MQEREQPQVMALLTEAEMLISRLDDRLTHVLLPPYPPAEAKNVDVAESATTRKLRQILRQLAQLNDRVEN